MGRCGKVQRECLKIESRYEYCAIEDKHELHSKLPAAAHHLEREGHESIGELPEGEVDSTGVCAAMQPARCIDGERGALEVRHVHCR